MRDRTTSIQPPVVKIGPWHPPHADPRVRLTKTTMRVRLYAADGLWYEFSLVDLLRGARFDATEAYNLMEKIITRNTELAKSIRGAFVSTFSGRRRAAFIEQHGRRCHYCRLRGDARTGPDGRAWHIDHIVPVSAGGTNELSNLALACARCNVAKGAR